MAKDSWDKVEIIGGVLGGVMIPIAIFLTGLVISNADKDNAETKAQAERLTELIDHLSSDNSKKQQIAVEVTSFLAKNDQLPKVLVPSLIRIATQSNNSDTAGIATETVLQVAKQDKKAAQTIKKAFSNIKPRRIGAR